MHLEFKNKNNWIVMQNMHKVFVESIFILTFYLFKVSRNSHLTCQNFCSMQNAVTRILLNITNTSQFNYHNDRFNQYTTPTYFSQRNYQMTNELALLMESGYRKIRSYKIRTVTLSKFKILRTEIAMYYEYRNHSIFFVD